MNWNLILISLIVLLMLLSAQRIIGDRWASFGSSLPLTSAPLVVAANLELGVQAAQAILLGCIAATAAASVTIYLFGRLAKQPLWVAFAIAVPVFVANVGLQRSIAASPEINVLFAFISIVWAGWSRGQVQAKLALSRSVTAPAQLVLPFESLASKKATVVFPCLILFLSLASISFLPSTWSGILSAAPLISLCFLTSLRQKYQSPEVLLRAIGAANQGLLAKSILFSSAYFLIDTELSWITAYACALALAIVSTVLVESVIGPWLKKLPNSQASLNP
jgi:hypothetical protein